MQLDEVVHARGRLARELEQIVGHAIVATLLVEFGHYREVLDDVRRYVGRQKLLAPRGHPHRCNSGSSGRGTKSSAVCLQLWSS